MTGKRFLYTSVPPVFKISKLPVLPDGQFWNFSASAGQPGFENPAELRNRNPGCPAAEKGVWLIRSHPPFPPAAEQRYNTLDFACGKIVCQGSPPGPPLETSRRSRAAYRGPKPQKRAESLFLRLKNGFCKRRKKGKTIRGRNDVNKQKPKKRSPEIATLMRLWYNQICGSV